ncbi:hypothetical protein K9M78_02190 [Candidatus Bipolaricaulota bacterium]|nr:hypothetical protein [Candidatus Bipolaricaulota bacterium]
MTKELSVANFLIRVGKFAKAAKSVRSKVAERFEIVSVLAVVLLFTSTVVVLSPVPGRAEQEKESEATVEGFSLFRYGDELTWKLTGKKAGEGDGDLVVQDFELLVRRSGSREGKPLYEFSGEEIRLNSASGDDLASIPEEVEIEIKDELRGVAESARYDFSTGKVSGNDLKLTGTGEWDETSLRGKSFEYGYKSGELKITKGFQVTIPESADGRAEISGNRLTWTPGGEIYTEGNVVARTDSGWKLSAGTMRWNPDEESLECFGPVVAVKGDTRVQGEYMTYDGKEEKIRVDKAKMIVKGQ